MKLTPEALAKQRNDGSEPEESKRPRYVRRNAAFALSDLPPLDYIVEGKIATQSVGMFYGDPGTKKTYSLVHLAVCVGMNKAWLNFNVKGCKVLVIDEESGELRLGRRLGMAIRGEFGDENIPVEFVSMANFKLDKKDDLGEIQKLIEESGAGLVIFDALADVMDGDENSKQDTQPVFNALRKLSEITGATLVIIHHANRSGSYRGSSAIKGSLDFMFKVESEDDSDYITFKSEKAREGRSASFKALAHWSDGQFWLTPVEIDKKPQRLSQSQKYVLGYLRENGASSLPNITGAADTCSPEAARKAIYKLAEMGILARVNRDAVGRGEKAIYRLVENDDEQTK